MKRGQRRRGRDGSTRVCRVSGPPPQPEVGAGRCSQPQAHLFATKLQVSEGVSGPPSAGFSSHLSAHSLESLTPQDLGSSAPFPAHPIPRPAAWDRSAPTALARSLGQPIPHNPISRPLPWSKPGFSASPAPLRVPSRVTLTQAGRQRLLVGPHGPLDLPHSGDQRDWAQLRH